MMVNRVPASVEYGELLVVLTSVVGDQGLREAKVRYVWVRGGEGVSGTIGCVEGM